MRNRASCSPIRSKVTAITLAWLRALSLGLLGVMLASTLAEAKPFAYVPNNRSGTVSVIDTATNAVVATVPVGGSPRQVAITPDGTRAYVTNVGALSVIDTATNTVVGSVPLAGSPGVVAITPDGTRAYVTIGFVTNGIVSVIDTATNTEVASVPFVGSVSGVAITPDGTRAYVANPYFFSSDDNVSVIDTATNTIVATVPVVDSPDGVAITPDGTRVYVTIRSGINGRVSVIDTATNTEVATVPMARENQPWGVAITPDGTHAYVVNGVGTGGQGNVSVIATATNTVVANVRVGWEPFGVAITPDGTHAYVVNSARQTIFPPSVSVIDTATNTEVANVLVGMLPFWVAITPVKFTCPLVQGLWKNSPDTWPVTSLTLGSQTYTQAELLTLFGAPPRGDASVILAHQLIAAKLNIANGSNPNPIRSTIADADKLLSQFFGKLPYNVETSSAIGQQMVNDATVLDRYNNGALTPECQP
jgi:YVTN family beta-propeller protein